MTAFPNYCKVQLNSLTDTDENSDVRPNSTTVCTVVAMQQANQQTTISWSRPLNMFPRK
jgi:hypothetical protein